MTFDGFDDLGAPGSYKTEMAILSNGNVSIGTATPGEKLNVEGNISFNGSNAIRIIKGQTDKYLQILSAWGYSGGSGIELHTDLDYGKGRISFVAGGNSSTDNAYEFMQYNGGANSGNMVILKDGRVLIGLGGYDAGVPMQKLTVDGDIALTRRNNPDGYRSILGTSDNYGLNLLAGIDGSNTGIRLFSKNNTSDSSHRGQIQFSSSVSTSGNDAYAFLNNGAAGYEALMLIKQDGKVTIGKDIVGKTPDGYNLYVSKGILTEKLKVANSGDAPNWYDFVFESDYDLMPLDKVEAYVKTNKHLPEIPSASEVAKDGIDVMEMDGKLLQKIEELTLYVIQQQKEIDLLKKQLKPNR
jgi:hypothetical protein